ncbi:MAG: glycine zipper 2TM domain-containing protein, partial [Limnohabitans sp.]
MKTLALSCALLALCGAAQAQETGQVLSRTAVYQQVAVPRQSCAQTVTPNAPTSGAGAVSGAVTGAVLGTIVGEGRGAGTLLGAVGGAIVGDRAESNANSQPVTTCTTQTVMENRLVGYNVVYQYAGKTYTVQLPQDPGPTISLQITPAGMQTTAQPVTAPTTVVTQPAVVYTQPAVVYAPAPVYYSPWPVSTSINLGWGWYGGGHRHWR